MERINADTIKTALKPQKTQKTEAVAVLLESTLPKIKFTEDNKAYVSIYEGEPAKENEVAGLLQSFFATYRIAADARPAYVATVLNEKMTLLRLRDALNSIYSTRKESAFGVPLPADIIAFDKKNEQKEIFNAKTTFDISLGIYRLYYDTKDWETCRRSTTIQDNIRKALFEPIIQNGKPVKDKEGWIVYEAGTYFEQYKKQIEYVKEQILLERLERIEQQYNLKK